MDSAEPMRVKDRTESDEPKTWKSCTEKSYNLRSTLMDNEEPRRRKPRIDNDDPSVAKLNNEKEEPTRVNDRSEIAEAT